MFDRLLMKRNVVEKDNYAKTSTFQELMKAIIEAIPTVLKPAKEMDRSKVINNPPKFLKVRILRERLRETLDHFEDCITHVQ